MEKDNSYSLHKLDIPKTNKDLTEFSFNTNEAGEKSNVLSTNQNQHNNNSNSSDNIIENGVAGSAKPIDCRPGPIELHGNTFNSRAKELFEELSEKRKLDNNMCEEFQTTIRNWSDDLIKQVIGTYAKSCEEKTRVFQACFGELTGHLEDVGRMERELQEIQNKVESLYKLTRG